MDVFQEIDYWINQLQDDLKIYDTEEKKEIVKTYFYKIAEQKALKYYILPQRKGIIAYCLYPDYRGELSLNELFMYIKPEHRGSIKLFKELVNHIEQAAKENNCLSIRIGANLKFKDSKILNALKHFGYKTDTVVKYLGE